jgi:PAS domain-containing protein
MQTSMTRHFWTSVAPALLGSIAIALLTLVCYRLQPGAVPAALLYLLVVVVVSVRGSLLASVWVSLIAVASLDYFFTGPTFRLYPIRETRDVLALIVFLTTALVINRLILRVRQSLREVEAAHEELRLVTDTVPTLLSSARPDGQVEFVNQRWRDFGGLSSEEVSFETRRLRLSVIDDGQGFAVEADFQAYGGHWGLLGMRERASQIHGKLSLRSTPGHGTEVVLLVPYVSGHRSATPSAASSSAF